MALTTFQIAAGRTDQRCRSCWSLVRVMLVQAPSVWCRHQIRYRHNVLFGDSLRSHLPAWNSCGKMSIYGAVLRAIRVQPMLVVGKMLPWQIRARNRIASPIVLARGEVSEPRGAYG